MGVDDVARRVVAPGVRVEDGGGCMGDDRRGQLYPMLFIRWLVSYCNQK